MLGGPVLSDTFWQSPKHCTRHATEPPTHPDNSTWLCLRAWPQENPRWEVSSCYRGRMEKLPAGPSGTLTLSKNRVPQVPSYNQRAIPMDCQGPVGPTSSLDQSSWHHPLGACCPGVRSSTRASATRLRQGRCSGNLVSPDRALSPHEREAHCEGGPPEQMTPASSPWLQLCEFQPSCGQLHSWDSCPEQRTLSKTTGPEPCPNRALPGADVAPPQPSCLHTTLASLMSQSSSHTVPQEPW